MILINFFLKIFNLGSFFECFAHKQERLVTAGFFVVVVENHLKNLGIQKWYVGLIQQRKA